MNEFKGTKGKWKISTDNEIGILITSTHPQNRDITTILLDFINRISGEMLRNDFVLDEKWYEQAKKIIKEATEI
jgi:hypothetical protein